MFRFWSVVPGSLPALTGSGKSPIILTMLHELDQQSDPMLQMSPYDLAKSLEGQREMMQRQETVFMASIDAEVVLVDRDHALDLAHAIQGPRGQIQPVLLRARILGDQVVYDPLDGYHRIKGTELLRAEQGLDWKGFPVWAVVLYNCSDEEMFDQRILAANSVKAVKFPRLAVWMKGAWQTSPWADKLTMSQAFSLAAQDSSGKKLGVTPEEAEAIKQWAREKAKKWLTPIGTLTQQLQIIEVADPDLVKRVRTGAFTAGGLSLTPSQLNVIVTAFPNHYEAQQTIANLASGLAYGTDELTEIVGDIKRTTDGSVTEIERMMRGGSRILYQHRESRLSYTPKQAIRNVQSLKRMVPGISSLANGDRESIQNHLEDIEKILKGTGKSTNARD